MKQKQILLFIVIFSFPLILSAIPVSAVDGIVPKKTDCYADSFNPGFPGTLACNNSDSGNPWLSGAGAYPHWLIINLTKTWILSSVALNCVGCGQGPASGHIDIWNGVSFVAMANWTGYGGGTNRTISISPTATNQIRVYGTAGIASGFDEEFEIWTFGHAVPATPVCQLGAMGTTLDTLIPILVSAALIVFALGFFYVSYDSKGHGRKGFSIELLIVGVIGLVIAIAVAAGAIASMKVC